MRIKPGSIPCYSLCCSNTKFYIHFLDGFATASRGEKVFATHGESDLSSEDRRDMSALAPCTHEEADSRVMIHAFDASLQGHRRIKIRSNDTDLVVLAVSIAPVLPLDELWISYGSSKQLRNLPAHAIATSLGQEKACVLPMFHALTGCDTVSFFGGRGKKTARDVWNVFPELTPVLKSLMMLPEDIDDTYMGIIERFVTLLYDHMSSLRKVNEVRQELFSRKGRSLDNIPPTKASLMQHVKRAVFLSGYIWGQTLLKQPTLPSPSRWGWQLEDSRWVPQWTTLSQAKDSCYELIRCGCKAGCRGRCKCQKASLTCTGLCNCGGNWN